MSRSSSGRYSEGELADSPDYAPRKRMADDEISLSLSEEDQNSDALDIKPPQPHSGYQSRERNRKRDRDRSRRGGADWSAEQAQSYNRGRDRKNKDSRYLSREERKELDSRKHSESRDRTRDSRNEDLRERLERERRLRKAEERAERGERRESESSRRRHSKQKREKRTERERRPNEVDELENVQIHHHRERGREERRRKRESEQYQTISSPESPSRNEYDQEVPDDEEEVKEDERNENSSSSSAESSDEGEASSTSSSSSNSEEGEASPEVTNGKHRATPSEVEEGEEEEPEIKRFKSEETVVAEEEVAEISHREVTPTPSPIELKEEPPYLPAIMGCRSVEEFQCLNKIEEGTYGVVYRARDKRTEEIVALKRLKMEREKEGFPITSLREVSTLLKAQHPNIVTVREIVVGSNMDKIFMVMDYVEHDLKSLMETLKAQKTMFLPGEVKCLLQQLLRAVAHLHDNWILHRDLKTSNLLLSHRGVLKVGDFGLAREYGSPLKPYTSIVVTLWYRAPELLLGAKEYSTPIDVWSVGCIFGELLTMEAIFQGKFEADQINKIFRDLGTPNDNVWPGYSELPAVKKATFTNNPVSNLRKKFSTRLGELGLDLLQKFLTYDPAKRITAEDALNHTYLKEHPLPIDPSIFPTWPAKSELHGPRKAQSPKPPSGGRAYKQLGDNDDDVVDTNSGFTMGNAHLDRRIGAAGAGFSLRF